MTARLADISPAQTLALLAGDLQRWGHHRGRHDELSRQDAARFAFLLATSVIAAAGAPVGQDLQARRRIPHLRR